MYKPRIVLRGSYENFLKQIDGRRVEVIGQVAKLLDIPKLLATLKKYLK